MKYYLKNCKFADHLTIYNELSKYNGQTHNNKTVKCTASSNNVQRPYTSYPDLCFKNSEGRLELFSANSGWDLTEKNIILVHSISELSYIISDCLGVNTDFFGVNVKSLSIDSCLIMLNELKQLI